jgi:hypothetical protein
VSPPPTPALCGHPRCCTAIPSTAAPSRHCGSPGRQDTTTPAAVRPPALRQPNSRADVRTMTKQEAPTPLPSKPLLDKHRTHHDAPSEARFVGTTINAVSLYTIPPYVALELCDMIVNRLPLAYKRRRRSPGRGGTTDSCTLAYFRLHHDIDTLPQSNLRDLEALPPLPPSL